ncbi:hypothetical protein IFR05_008305 [Cadophora sp. M221]|nr:hypothetical protein IFR05_008305 [Cadophora sp. M221]
MSLLPAAPGYRQPNVTTEQASYLPFNSGASSNTERSTGTTIAGVTIKSPGVYWIYSKVKILTAPAITGNDGQIVCATDTIFSGYEAFTGLVTDYAWGLVTIPYTTGTKFNTVHSTDAKGFLVSVTTVMETNDVRYRTGISSWPTRTSTYPEATNVVIHSSVQEYFKKSGNSVTDSGVEISLAIPFAYLQRRSVACCRVLLDPRCRSPPLENYGYPPQELIDYLAAGEHYVSVYPNIRNCLPGGPAIDITPYCSPKSPKIQYWVAAGGDLTSSTTVFVTSSLAAEPAIKPTDSRPIQTTGLVLGTIFTPSPLPIPSESGRVGQASVSSPSVVAIAPGSGQELVLFPFQRLEAPRLTTNLSSPFQRSKDPLCQVYLAGSPSG